MTYAELAEKTKAEGDLFRAAQTAYRSRQIGDEEFLAARKRYIEFMDSTDDLVDQVEDK